jgi:hypothetical protein
MRRPAIAPIFAMMAFVCTVLGRSDSLVGAQLYPERSRGNAAPLQPRPLMKTEISDWCRALPQPGRGLSRAVSLALTFLRVLRAPIFALSVFTLSSFPSAHANSAAPQQKPKEEKSVSRTVWNFDGGVVFQTDGSAPGGACFRLSGRLTAPQFFDGLKRIDDEHGTQYRSGTEVVAEFPDQVALSFVIRDFPCANQLQQTGSRIYLTQALVTSMRLSLYWKRGIELRPTEKVSDQHFYIKRVVPYATENVAQLPERFEWSYRLTVPSAGVPLTDDLVLVLRGPDGRIAARVAARL